jgi:hypothetical protein
MTAPLFDQKVSLNRIGYDGPLEPTLAVLNGLIFTTRIQSRAPVEFWRNGCTLVELPARIPSPSFG